MSNSKFFKNNQTDKIFWVDNADQVGVWLFSFDMGTGCFVEAFATIFGTKLDSLLKGVK